MKSSNDGTFQKRSSNVGTFSNEVFEWRECVNLLLLVLEILSKDASSAPAKRIAVDKKDIGHHHDKNPSVWMRS